MLMLYALEESILTAAVIIYHRLDLLTSLAGNYNVLEEADKWKILARVD